MKDADDTMRNPLSKVITEIEPSGIRKFFDIVSEMKDAISLGVGEPDFDTPWHIRDEGIYSLEKGRTFYTSNAGLKELKIEISNFLNRKYGLDYDYNHEIMVTVGGSEAIDIAMRAMLDPGDEVLIPQPSYVSYLPCARLAGGVPVIIELKAENQFRLTEMNWKQRSHRRQRFLYFHFRIIRRVRLWSAVIWKNWWMSLLQTICMLLRMKSTRN